MLHLITHAHTDTHMQNNLLHYVYGKKALKFQGLCLCQMTGNSEHFE